LWLDFLNQETPFITGTDTLARKFDYPVFYVDIRMPSRGHYDVYFKTIAIDPPSMPEGEITNRFATFLEENILLNPSLWLWSHNRFKWKKDEV
jgi:KDO2-lipid IV(A) lauroyltransferase